MNAIIAVKDLIKQNKNRVKVLKQQLKNHEEGISKLSPMAFASTELGLTKSQDVLDKNELILKELEKRDLLELEKEQQLKEAITRNNYYKYQKIRLKRNKVMSNDQKLEAMMIIDELPEDFQLEDEDLSAIAETTINLNLRIHADLYEQLKEIQKDWNNLQQNFKLESIDKLGMLNIHIPILVLHLNILLSNIEENIQEHDLPAFKGLPTFEDWWISELWTNHQAYLGLYKWRSIISSLCISSEQKSAWNIIFSNWVFIKKILHNKAALGFEYNFAFDSLIERHTKLKEELNIDNLTSMEKIIQNITAQEDFTKYKSTHNIETPYLKFKQNKTNYQVQ